MVPPCCLICIFLLTCGVECLFTCPFAICASSLARGLFRFFCPFLSELFVLIFLSAKRCLYILSSTYFFSLCYYNY